MFNALLLTAVLASSTGSHGHTDGCDCHHFTPQNQVEKLVLMAWKKADEIQIDPTRQKDLDRDIALGKEYAKEVDKQLKASKNEEMIKRVQKIGAEMSGIANSTQAEALWGDTRPSKFPYEFRVVEGEDVNAFSLPGGIIYVYEGLVKYVESDDELAGVMGHEISHAAFRHVWALQRKSEKLQIAQILAVIVAAMTRSKDATNVMQGVQLGAQSMISTWGVDAEKAADFGGFQYMLKSKYDPTGMITMMERLARDEKSRPSLDWGIYRTHPPSKERAQDLIADMEERNLPIHRSAVTTSFRVQIKPGDAGTVEAWFSGHKLYTFAGTDALARADASAEKLDAFFDKVPQMIEVTEGKAQVLYNFRPLLDITPDDAANLKTSVQTLTEQTTKTIKGALFTLGYRIWG